MAIDIGAGAANYGSGHTAEYTFLDLTNPANATGTLTSFEIWYNTDGTGVKAGTFYYHALTEYTYRDHELLGSVTSGSKQTFTGKNCDVNTSDYLAERSETGQMCCGSGGSGSQYKDKTDIFSAGTHKLDLYVSGDRLALYAYGVEALSFIPQVQIF